MKAITQQLKRFVDDERAVSPVVGFVLIFALIMIVFTIYNADVVPTQNEQVEYEHSRTIEEQIEQLSAAFISAGADDSTKSVSLQLGVQYPNRVFGINPGTPVGTLNTTGPYMVELSGAAESQAFNTSFVNYLPNYNLKGQETQYSIEHGLLVKDYENSENTRLESTGALFSSDGETVNLRLLSSNLAETRMSTVVTAENVDTHTITVSSGTADLSFPTTLEREEWNRTISGSEQVENWDYSDNSSGVNRVNIELKTGTSINVNRVTAGNPPPEGEIGMQPSIQNVTQTSINASLNSTTELAVRTVDIFGSSYGDVDIDATTTGGGNLTPITTTSNSSGLATFAYESVPSDSGSMVNITADLPNRTGENTSVTFEIRYPSEESDEPPSAGGTIDPSEVDSPPLDTRAISRSQTHPSFKLLVPSSNNSTTDPIQISGFAVETKNDLSGTTETQESPGGRTHNFYIYDTGLGYDSETPLQLDGTIYSFDTEGATTESRVQLERFQPSGGIRLEDTVDSYAEADITYWFVLTDGTVRPIYFDATTR